MNKLIQRYLLLVLNTTINTFFPFLIIPLITSKASDHDFGYYAYVLNLYSIFCMLSQIGINTIGMKRLKTNFCQTEVHNSLLVLNLAAATFFSLIFLLLTTFSNFLLLDSNYIKLAFVATLIISAFNLEWVLYHNNNFKAILNRNILIKILFYICTYIYFLFKNNIDVIIVLFLGFNIIGYLMVFGYSNINICLSKIKCREYIKDIKEHSILRVLVAVKENLDTIIVGGFIGVREAGIYYFSIKIIRACVAVLSQMNLVVFNREDSDISGGKKIIYFQCLISVFAAVIINYAFEHIYILFFNESYNTQFMIYLSPLIFLLTLNNYISLNYFIKHGRENFLIFAYAISIMTFPIFVILEEKTILNFSKLLLISESFILLLFIYKKNYEKYFRTSILS